MSYISNQGEQSTSTEITALTNLAVLAASGAGQFIRKTGTTTFENATPAGAAISFSDAETPSGTINGSNVTFTLAHTPSPAASLILTYQGQGQAPAGVDFTLAVATITFVSAPLTGATLLAWYRY